MVGGFYASLPAGLDDDEKKDSLRPNSCVIPRTFVCEDVCLRGHRHLHTHCTHDGIFADVDVRTQLFFDVTI